MNTLASSFADPADVRAFNRCKASGKSDVECFKVGDNGVGCWGDLTAQMHTPMVALPPQEMEKQWGSVAKAKHKKVFVALVTAGGSTWNYVACVLADVMPRKANKSGAGIDLNPAASAALGLKPPHLVKVEWKWGA